VVATTLDVERGAPVKVKTLVFHGLPFSFFSERFELVAFSIVIVILINKIK
jgi:hypothetical protein